MRTSLALVVLGSLAIAGAGWAQPPAGSAVTPEALADGWRANIRKIKERQALSPPPTSVAEKVARLRELDTAARAFDPIYEAHLSPAEEKRTMDLFRNEWRALDMANSEALKPLIPADGWFQISRDGDQVAADAWFIVQHSPDHALQKDVVRRMKPLVDRREASGERYALLYDRTEMFEGRPQRYGSQGRCISGAMGFYELEDPARVDEWRKAIGMKQTLAEYAQLLGIGRPCAG